MVEIRKIRGATAERVANAVREGLKKVDFDARVDVENSTSVKVSGVRLSNAHIEKHGKNISPHSGRLGNVLGWNDWVKFNNMVNSALDKLKASANAHSLGGKFKIREGKRAYTEADWEALGNRNVGSMINPVYARDSWVSEETPKIFVKGRWKVKKASDKNLSKVI